MGKILLCSQCLLNMSLRLYSDLIQWKSIILAAMASLTRWNAKILCLLLKVECGSVALVTTDLLSPNIYDLDLMCKPRYLSVYLMSMICSVAVLAATNSDPYVAVSTVACFLEYRGTSTGQKQLIFCQGPFCAASQKLLK